MSARGRTGRHRALRSTLLAVLVVVTAAPASWALPTSAVTGSGGSGPVIPSQGAVDAAKKAAAAAAAQVTQLNADYAAAQQRLNALQTAVSTAADTYARAQQELATQTALTQAAQDRAARNQKAAEQASIRLSKDAAAIFQGGGSLANLALFIGATDPQQMAQIAQDLSQVQAAQAADLRAARSTAALARLDAAAATVAQQLQEQDAAAADAALVAVQQQAAAATTMAAKIDAEQQTMVAKLATLTKTSKQLEQQRLDGLAAQRAAAARAAAAAKAAQAAAAAGYGSYPTSGGSATLTYAQLHPQAVAQSLMPSFGFGPSQWSCLVSLWNGESGWRWNADNPSSGAYGIPQSLPGSKMATVGSDWMVNPVTQIRWGLSYIQRAYGSPCTAWYTWLSRSPHWY